MPDYRGPQVTPATREAAPRTPPGWFARNTELALSLAAGALTAIGWLARFEGAPRSVWLTLFLVAYLFGALDILRDIARDLRNNILRFNVDLLMLIAALGAAVIDAWAEGAFLLFLFSLGHALESYAMGRTRRAIEALRELAPDTAVVLRSTTTGTTEVRLPIEEVAHGDTVVIKAGERFSVDGEVAEGTSAVNQAAVTGESMPVDKQHGDPVFAGTVNGEGTLLVTVTAAVGDRTLDRVIRLVAEARSKRAPTQLLAQRFERIFVPIVLVTAVLLILVPPLMGFWSWDDAVYRAMTFLVGSSPCALALGTPSAILSGIAQGARNGVLIKGGAYLEGLGTIRVFAFDKTGTITKGEPEVTDVVPAAGISADELLSAAAAVESRSQHPLAKAVMREAARRGLNSESAVDVQNISGRGVQGVANGAVVQLGNRALYDVAGVSIPGELSETAARLQIAGRSIMIVRRVAYDSDNDPANDSNQDLDRASNEGVFLGVLGLADEPRPEVHRAFASLRRLGAEKLIMLTGDNEGVAHAIGDQFGFDQIHASLFPEAKARIVGELASTGTIAMTGDGVNDAPALAVASIGIAMGGAGTAAALETADMALMGDDLNRLPYAIELSRATRRIIAQNIMIAMSVIVFLIVASVTGWISIGIAVVMHEGSTLVVIMNALRLLAFRSTSLP